MADNKTKTAPQDSSRVNVNEDYEVQYWTNKFNCSKEQLRDAVDSVGTSAEKVAEYIRGASGK
jgi:hypothetical protein